MATPANLALEGGDPRDTAHPALHGAEPAETQLLHEIHDPSITFEEYSTYIIFMLPFHIFHLTFEEKLHV